MELIFGVFYFVLAIISMFFDLAAHGKKLNPPTWSLLILANIWFAASLING